LIAWIVRQCVRLLLRQLELDVDRRDDLNRLVVEQRRFVTPLLNGIECGISQVWIGRADRGQTDQRSIGADEGLKVHSAFDACIACTLWIYRLHLADQIGCRDNSTHAYAPRKRLRSRLSCSSHGYALGDTANG